MRQTGRTDEQIVLYVLFAGCILKLPTAEILSMASEQNREEIKNARIGFWALYGALPNLAAGTISGRT